MRVKKPSLRPPHYPSRRQFLAALGIGAFASVAHADTPPLPPGLPPPPREVPEEIRLLGDIAVVPPLRSLAVAPTLAGTNTAPRLGGEPPALTNGCRSTGPSVPGAACTNTYVIQPGDTLTGIAKKRLGDPGRWEEIQALNATLDPQALTVGAVIVLPQVVNAVTGEQPVPAGGIRVVPQQEQPIRTLGRLAHPRQGP